jgi:hypothetical protein
MSDCSKGQPDNYNQLYADSYRLIIHKAPNTTYWCESVEIPGVNVPGTDQPTTFADVWWPGDTMVFDEVSMVFHVDEDLENWLEIFRWMTDIGRPEVPLSRDKDIKDLVGDIAVMTTTNSKNPNKVFYFTDAFPVSLSGLSFDSTLTDAVPLKATVSFRYCTMQLRDSTDQNPCIDP